MSRWIKLHISIFDHGLFSGKEFSERDAWVWLIARAAWKDTTHRVAGTVLPVPAGSLFATLRELQHAWRWGSDYRVRSFLKLLENERMIAVNSNAGKTQITICNYSTYQHVERTENAGATQETTHGKRKDNALKEEGLEIIENIDSLEREAGGEKDLDLMGFQKWFLTWPTSLTDDKPSAEIEWSKLSPGQRTDVTAETPKFIQGVMVSKRKYFPNAAKYLAERMWERLKNRPPPPAAPLTPHQQRQKDAQDALDNFLKDKPTDDFMGTTIDIFAEPPTAEARKKAAEADRAEHIRKMIEHNNSWGT